MTLVSLQGGFVFPADGHGSNLYKRAMATDGTLDATAEKFAFLGYVQMNGRTTSSKTISAAGGGSISFKTGTCTFADGSTTLDVGIQDIHATTSLPDGTFDVSVTLTGGAGITTTAWNTVSMTGGTGTKTISHGDLIAVVLDMTARAGSDSVIIQRAADSSVLYGGAAGQSFLPASLQYTTSWQTSRATPNVIITFDDGTIATLEGATFFSAAGSTEGFSDSTDPDERGHIFQVPFNCKVGGYVMTLGAASITASDATIGLWSTPLGTPALISGSGLTLDAEKITGAAFYTGSLVLSLPTEVSLSKDTDYVLAIKAAGSSNISMVYSTLGDAAYRALLPGGTTVAKVTRNAGSGAFAAESPAITRYSLGLLITQIDDGAGGGGMLVNPGMNGRLI